MAKKLSFVEFKTSIEELSMPTEMLHNYVQFDPDSPIPRLSFRSDALTDQPPADYDVDRAIHQLLRQLENERDKQRDTFFYMPKRSVVAEGDSWFRLPFWRYEIGWCIQWNNHFRIKNIAYWGHTLGSILQKKEYLEVIKSSNPDYFMLSAGGNDLLVLLASKKLLSGDGSLTKDGKQALSDIKSQYRELLCEVTSKFPDLKVLTYGYDYPRPLVGEGRFIGRHLRELGILDNKMTPIMASVLDRLNTVIKEAGSVYPNNVHYLNCRGVTESYTWYDDMHPGKEGFLALSGKFEEKMNAW